MPQFHFTEDFDFIPDRRSGLVTIAYKAGTTETVTSKCAKEAQAAGKGEVVKGKATDSDGDQATG